VALLESRPNKPSFVDVLAGRADLAGETSQRQRHLEQIAIGIGARFLVFPLSGCVAAKTMQRCNQCGK
jgi:hypothetical protein